MKSSGADVSSFGSYRGISQLGSPKYFRIAPFGPMQHQLFISNESGRGLGAETVGGKVGGTGQASGESYIVVGQLARVPLPALLIQAPNSLRIYGTG